MDLNASVSEIPFVGSYYLFKLKKVGVETIQDLLYHIPSRYENFSLQTNILSTQSGEKVTIKGQITSINLIFTKNGKRLVKAVISDGEGILDITWFNQTYLAKALPPGTWVSLSGKLEVTGSRRTMVSPVYEKISGVGFQVSDRDTIHTGRLVPVYPETSGLSSKWLRSRIANILPKVESQIEEYLPQNLLTGSLLVTLPEAIKMIHFPDNLKEAEIAKRRLAFDEFFKLQLKTLHRKQTWKTKKVAHILDVDQDKVLDFINSLPFSLTSSQVKAVKEILNDLGKPQAMNRLLEGDVGSGKTVVAAIACFIAHQNGFHSAIMAPTQILASQHYKTLQNILSPHGIKVGLIASGQNKKQKESQTGDVVVGTHALLHRAQVFKNVALVVIDEQHRFGVAQRALLSQRGTKAPHVLTMTATPIPRTVALTMYGDLDLSLLDELPRGRVKIKTWVVPPQKRDGAYKWIRERVKNTDEQAFIVCPIIEVSEKETMKSVKAASQEYETLKNKIFPDLKLALLHGRIKSQEKDKIMEEFKSGKTDILVATPVVEVGIDIPNATIMMIEASERFGLAQLHQLRGRVGRGNKQSYCLLMTDSRIPRVLSRLKALERNFSGAKLAEIDLETRGPGEIYGTNQSGFPELKVGDYSDLNLIKAAREAAEKILPQINKYPKIKKLLETKSEIAPN